MPLKNLFLIIKLIASINSEIFPSLPTGVLLLTYCIFDFDNELYVLVVSKKPGDIQHTLILNLLNSSKFDYNSIKNILFFGSGRFDIKLKNELLIRFPINYTKEIIDYGSDLLNNKKFVNSKIIDLRINNRIIKYE